MAFCLSAMPIGVAIVDDLNRDTSQSSAHWRMDRWTTLKWDE